MIDAFCETDIDGRRSGGWNHVARLFAGPGTAHAADVQRGKIDQFDELLPGALGASQPKFGHELAIHIRRLGDRAAFRLAQRLDAIIEVLYQYPSVVVLHRGQEPREHHGGVRSPVSIVAAVQLSPRTVYGDVERGHATRTEDDLLPAALMYRPIA